MSRGPLVLMSTLGCNHVLLTNLKVYFLKFIGTLSTAAFLAGGGTSTCRCP